MPDASAFPATWCSRTCARSGRERDREDRSGPTEGAWELYKRGAPCDGPGGQDARGTPLAVRRRERSRARSRRGGRDVLYQGQLPDRGVSVQPEAAGQLPGNALLLQRRSVDGGRHVAGVRGEDDRRLDADLLREREP